MKVYKKPHIVNMKDSLGVVPLILNAAALSVGGAFAVGVASGLMKDKRYDEPQINSLKKVDKLL